jgi:superfamily I DNA/RNA helicase
MGIMKSATNRFDSLGENELWDFFSNINHNYLIYHNYIVEKREFDFLLIDNENAIFIIEVKGILAERINAIKGNTIYYNNARKKIQNPRNQANRYKNNLLNKIGKNIFIIPVVAYPYISEKEFFDKEMNLLSARNETILLEDIENYERIKFFIKNLLDEYKNRNDLCTSLISQNEIVEVRALFETKIEIEDEPYSININNKDDNIISEIEEKKNVEKVEIFSILLCKNNFDVDELYECWESGAKVFLFSENKDLIKKFKEYIKIQIYNGKIKKDISTSKGIYNLSITYVENINKDFEIINGENLSEYDAILNNFEKDYKFNYQQYKVIHSSLDKDVIVKASAGTGKTYAMVSRILYIIIINKYNENNFHEMIALITFTNKATDEMKKRLEEEFKKYFLITNKLKYLKMMSMVNIMCITTIDSFFTDLIKNNASKVGYGLNISLKKSKVLYKKFIEDEINTRMEKSEEFKKSIKFYWDYDLINKIYLLSDKLDSKNILIEKIILDFDSEEYLIKEIVDIIVKVRQNTRLYLEERNMMLLSDVANKLNTMLNNFDDTSIPFKYIFIDEFQDTSNLQIDIFGKIKKNSKPIFFLVGDIKQCIYRFRGADHQSFDKISDELNLNEEDHEYIINYRSSGKLIEKFNRGFKKWNGIFENTKVTGGFEIDLEPIICKKYSDSIFEKEILAYLSEIFDKYKEKTLDNPITIGILVREGWQVKKIVNILRYDYQHVLITETNKYLYNIDSTIDLYKLLQAFLNSSSKKHLYNLLTTSYLNEKLDKKYIEKNKYYFYTEVFPKFEEYLKDFTKKPVLAVIQEIINDVKPWNNYSEDNAKKLFYKRNLEKIIEEIVFNFDVDYLALDKIVAILGQRIKTRFPSEVSFSLENENVIIHCNTIHKAKGLEYDYVMLPYVGAINFGTKKGLSFYVDKDNKIQFKFELKAFDQGNQKKSLKTKNYNIKDTEREMVIEEEKRLLYVALTRTKKQLVYFNKINAKSNETYKKYIEEL